VEQGSADNSVQQQHQQMSTQLQRTLTESEFGGDSSKYFNIFPPAKRHIFLQYEAQPALEK